MLFKKEIAKMTDVVYWEQGYLDLWSVVHFLAGAVWAFIPFVMNVSVLQAFFISFTLLVTWEVIEVIKNIVEPTSNRIADVLIGVVGYWLLYFLLVHFEPGKSTTIGYFLTFTAATLAFSSFAWFSYSRYKDTYKKVGNKIVKVKR